MPGNIFISYRREDTAGYAGRLYDRLRAAFPGRVFIDVGEIQPGADFVQTIEQHIEGCTALIALIGANWTAHDRLQNTADFVRLELSSGLKRNASVIPVLVGGATLPSAAALPEDLQPLLRKQAMSISDEEWDHGCQRLIEALQTVVGSAEQTKKAGRWNLALAFTTKRWVLTFALGTMGLLAVAPVLYLRTQKPTQIATGAAPANMPETTSAAREYDKSVAKGYENAAKVMDDLANQIGAAGKSATPTITSITPTKGRSGTLLTIKGSNFGASQGTSTVKLFTGNLRPDHDWPGSPNVPVVSWSNASIIVRLPATAPVGGSLVVSVAGVDSTAAGFAVDNP